MTQDQSAIPLGRALAVWAIAWSFGGVVLGQIVLSIAGVEVGATISTETLAALAVVSWVTMLIGVAFASGGARQSLTAVSLRFSTSDLVWLPVGVIAQLVAVPVVYLPLRAIWPDNFDPARLEETARDLVDAAGGFRTLLLVMVVAVGAPLVEEIVYRGMIQRSAVIRFGPVTGWIGGSLFFAAIHLRPVEFPGLAVAGAVFGIIALRTGRIGGAVVAHAAFNATGLLTLIW
ncbi:MAG: CPBP family intramembrane metalloprotease [Actinomycetota bacterium]|nr:CPBP family intramembrane metalloprotease [Actinomycetota bacterium]